MDENVKRVDNRLDDYIKDSNENNIHDDEELQLEDWVHHMDRYQRIYEEKTKLANT